LPIKGGRRIGRRLNEKKYRKTKSRDGLGHSGCVRPKEENLAERNKTLEDKERLETRVKRPLLL